MTTNSKKSVTLSEPNKQELFLDAEKLSQKTLPEPNIKVLIDHIGKLQNDNIIIYPFCSKLNKTYMPININDNKIKKITVDFSKMFLKCENVTQREKYFRDLINLDITKDNTIDEINGFYEKTTIASFIENSLILEIKLNKINKDMFPNLFKYDYIVTKQIKRFILESIDVLIINNIFFTICICVKNKKNKGKLLEEISSVYQILFNYYFFEKHK